jgi:hypothetical protein
MAYGDRMTLEIKDFGRKVVISVSRGKIVCRNNKKATITYSDSPVRGKPKGARSLSRKTK